jgi:hypothetical protein
MPNAANRRDKTRLVIWPPSGPEETTEERKVAPPNRLVNNTSFIGPAFTTELTELTELTEHS